MEKLWVMVIITGGKPVRDCVLDTALVTPTGWFSACTFVGCIYVNSCNTEWGFLPSRYSLSSAGEKKQLAMCDSGRTCLSAPSTGYHSYCDGVGSLEGTWIKKMGEDGRGKKWLKLKNKRTMTITCAKIYFVYCRLILCEHNTHSVPLLPLSQKWNNLPLQ